MGSTKIFNRTTLPFDKPVQISKSAREHLVNSFGYVRAQIDGGIVVVQVKKHKNKQRELVRINTNVTPPTIEFVMEDSPS